jgi:hypothetical protein
LFRNWEEYIAVAPNLALSKVSRGQEERSELSPVKYVPNQHPANPNIPNNSRSNNLWPSEPPQFAKIEIEGKETKKAAQAAFSHAQNQGRVAIKIADHP